MNILVITDNKFLYVNFLKIIKDKELSIYSFEFMCSKDNEFLKGIKNIFPIDLKKDYKNIIGKYDYILSLHSKQIFPKELVNSEKCINIHPGLNPYNRGWFPHIFSIINGLPCGVTIHWMDEKIDHGKIIIQEEVKMIEWESSENLYSRILEKELIILKTYLNKILSNKIKCTEYFPKEEGNMNTKKDFQKLCKIDLEEKVTMKEAINKLRALSYENYKNAYIETKNGKIYLSLKMELIKNES